MNAVIPPPVDDAAVLPEAPEPADAPAAPEDRLAYLFRHCPSHPLRQILADHRGVQA